MEFHRLTSVPNLPLFFSFFLKDEQIYESTSSLGGALFCTVLALASTHAKSIPEVIFLLRFLFPVCQRSGSAARAEGCLRRYFTCLFSLLEQIKGDLSPLSKARAPWRGKSLDGGGGGGGGVEEEEESVDAEARMALCSTRLEKAKWQRGGEEEPADGDVQSARRETKEREVDAASTTE